MQRKMESKAARGLRQVTQPLHREAWQAVGLAFFVLYVVIAVVSFRYPYKLNDGGNRGSNCKLWFFNMYV